VGIPEPAKEVHHHKDSLMLELYLAEAVGGLFGFVTSPLHKECSLAGHIEIYIVKGAAEHNSKTIPTHTNGLRPYAFNNPEPYGTSVLLDGLILVAEALMLLV